MGKYLLDAVVIRPLIIGIVVMYHAFIILFVQIGRAHV